jgi:heme exporter protein D
MRVPNLVKIKDNEHLLKDMSTGAILNTDRTAVLKHEKIMREIEKEKRRDQEINNLKSELTEIKQLLQTLVKKD